MAPITCKVIDSFHRGVAGVHATLHCRDQNDRLTSVFESSTDSDGDIKLWFRSPFVAHSRPEAVDITATPSISVAFAPPSHLTQIAEPWVRIYNDLHLPAEYSHCLILHLFQHQASYRLEHARTPVLGPLRVELGRNPSSSAWDLMQCDTPPRTPSPLRLPSPVLDGILSIAPSSTQTAHTVPNKGSRGDRK